MTESTNANNLDADQMARIAEIRARRAGSAGSAPKPAAQLPSATAERTRRPRSRHPALGGRIVAAGIGASGVLGLVAAFGIANATEDTSLVTESESTASTLTQQTPTTTAVPTLVPLDADTGAIPGSATNSAADALVAPTPIYLTANPVVRTITVQPPPVIVTVIDQAPDAAVGGVAIAPASQSQAVSPQPSLAATQPGTTQAQSQPITPARSAAPVVVPPAAPPQAAAAPAATAPATAPVPTQPIAPAPAPPKSSGSG